MKRNFKLKLFQMLKINYKLLSIPATILILSACGAGKDDTGTEYAPNMYHAVSYEPLIQITDKESGAWVSSDEDEYGEYYSSNPNNAFSMNMREPVANTVARSTNGMLPYRIPKDSLELAARVLENPFPASDEILKEGKVLYVKYCTHCHGENGQGSMDETAKVGQVYKGVPAYNKGRVASVNGGHIFHVITHGKGLMGAHGSQVQQEDRWKIVRYVETLQKQQ
jgi:mono/diheme cytochrome c family protein